MKNGKHAATEVPAAMTLDDCWQLVENAEKYRKHCVMMENCNYDRPELMVFNMVRQGLFGEILHAEGGYLHDLREHQVRERGRRPVAPRLGDEAQRQPLSHARPRARRQLHGHQPRRPLRLSRVDERPVARAAGLGARALSRGRAAAGGEVRARRRQRLAHPTARGRTIYVSHDTNLPRPYSRIHIVQGTKGLFQGYPNRVYVEGRSPEHEWEDGQGLSRRSTTTRSGRISRRDAKGAGHGGMDYIEDYRLIKCLREGLPTDMNVYDAAALSAVVHLSERPNARRSSAVDFPDFTRGRWQSTQPLGIVRA